MATDTALEKAYQQLKQIRQSKTLSLKPCPLLREEIIGLDGTVQPFKFRYYQCQGIFHLLVMRRMVLGDATGLGKTAEAIGALCYLWSDSEPDAKVIVVCPKSALRQWKAEVERFTKGVNVILATGSSAQRKAAYQAFAKAPAGKDHPKTILLLNYHLLVRDWTAESKEVERVVNGKKVKTITPGLLDGITASIPKLTIIYDEATAFKNSTTKTFQVCRQLSIRVNRCYGLTATLLKNNLIEGFAIYKVIKLDELFNVKQHFLDTFCVTQLQRVAGNRKIPIVVGYKNLDQFRLRIDPFFLGRQKHMVSNELPALTTKEVVCELSALENRKYGEALEGVLELGDGEVKEYEDTKALTSLIYCQEVADSLALIRYKEGDVISSYVQMNALLDEEGPDRVDFSVERGAKEQALVDLLTSELEGEKVIVYTRFERMVTRMQAILAEEKIKSVRITGKENDKKRAAAQGAFQDLKSDTHVIFITDAGSEAINLQAAAAIVFFDSPWSWGQYLQLLGRMIRIGSPHQNVFAIHLVAARPGEMVKDQKTIDHHVLDMLRKKKGFIDKVLGEAAVGALQFGKGEGNALQSLVRCMQGKGE